MTPKRGGYDLDKLPKKGRAQAFRYNGVNAELTDALFNTLDPRYWIQHEKPWHRRTLELLKQGFTASEIAQILDKSRNQVDMVIKQPWAQEYLIKKMSKSVDEEMKEFLQGEVLPSLEKLRAIRDSDAAPVAEQAKAANSLLDRFLGKPTQPITDDRRDPKDLTDAELARKVERLVGGVPEETTGSEEPPRLV